MFSNPEKIIEQIGIEAGMEIADLGTGSGFYAIAVGKTLHATGKVYAVDAQKELLTKLKNHAVREKVHNIEVIWGDIEKSGGTHLRDNTIDLALVCNVLFQVSDRLAVIQEAKRILKPEGRLLVVDWSDSFGGIGPKSDMVFKKDAAVALLQKEGFKPAGEISAGSHHYGIIGKK